MNKLILIACFLRLLTQMFANEQLYAIGIFGFELLALIYFYKQTKGTIQTLMLFFIGIASYDLFKYLVLNPYKFDLFEYLNTIIGILFIFAQYVYKRISIRHNTRRNSKL